MNVQRSGPGSGPCPEDAPQAIADENPGWEVGYTAGQWTAWCPAVTVHATTAAELCAIDDAICGDDQ